MFCEALGHSQHREAKQLRNLMTSGFNYCALKATTPTYHRYMERRYISRMLHADKPMVCVEVQHTVRGCFARAPVQNNYLYIRNLTCKFGLQWKRNSVTTH